MRTYSTLDLVRFAVLAKENPDLKPWDQVKLYNETVKELTPKERLDNLMRALGLDKETQDKLKDK